MIRRNYTRSQVGTDYFKSEPKDSKDKKGNYHPIIWKGQQLSNKGFAFYLTGKFGRESFMISLYFMLDIPSGMNYYNSS